MSVFESLYRSLNEAIEFETEVAKRREEKRMRMTQAEASNILRLLASESLDGVSRFVESENNRNKYKQAYEMAIKALEDAVQIVRCKDCRYWDKDWEVPLDVIDGEAHYCPNIDLIRNGAWFCADGERRSDD